ncbi:putative tpa inducible protein [Rosellinia necatrix]|uniref:Transcription initiation factor TFIID subunit 4 n=1 Tax=Rosellinia necatrix TaxID=77044 RepID=A0A1W2TC65_ROSNE|nr:putative tpa inducible protein [Rosellinia necatrix]
MSHPQPSLAQRQFSPPQASSPSPSNATTAAGFSLPPSKRPKVSPAPLHSQPSSPYANSVPYAASPPSGAATPTATGLPSPGLPVNMAATTYNTTAAAATATATQIPQSQYNASYQSNGRFVPMPQAQSSPVQSPVPVPSQPPAQSMHQPFQPPRPSYQTPTPTSAHTQPQYSQSQLAPMNSSTPIPTTGNMGPPTIHPSSSFSAPNDGARQQTRPPPKTTAYEMNDMLMGTGIDLDEEAEYMNNLETRTGFPHLPAGGSDSLYGAGAANQPAEPTDAKSQEEYAAIAADRAWNEAAHRLAVTRSQEMRQHLLEPGIVHRKMHEVAQKFGLGLNLDLKADGRNQYMGKFTPPTDFPKPELKVVFHPADDASTQVKTHGSFIPREALLVDQIALLSIGAKERLRALLGDANKIAETRQKSAHGVIPTEWLDAAAPLSPSVTGTYAEDGRIGTESAVSPRTNPLKRSSNEISSNGGLPTPVSEASPPNHVVESLVDLGKQSQSAEEGRLRKRQKRLEKAAEKDKEGAEAGSRSGSVAPGTPGSIAPDGGDTKSLSKKEGKKAAAKAAEGNSSTTVNTTLSLFTGGKKKKYSWMNQGAGGGASTPRPQGTPGALSGTGGGATKAGRGPLTKAGVTHLGQFREDSEKGKNIQLRDWIIVLEDRGLDLRSLQAAYGRVDKSDTGNKTATEMS